MSSDEFTARSRASLTERRSETLATLSIEVCGSIDQIEYRQWLMSDPNSLLYGSPEFLAYLRAAVKGKTTTLLARRGDRVVGALTYMGRRVSGMGSLVNSLPWYGSHGACLPAGSNDIEARLGLLQHFRSRVLNDELISATIILTPAEEPFRDAYIEALKPKAIDARIGQITELPTAGPDFARELEFTLEQKTRNLVRKARRQGFVEVVTNDDWAWQFLYNLHLENMTVIGGRAKPWSHFMAMRSCLPEPMRRLSVAMLEGEPIAAMLLFFFNRTVEYVIPAIKVEHRSSQPLSFLIWQAMTDAATRGYRRWNWGGTWETQESLHHFKAGWGAKDWPYTYLTLASGRGLAAIRDNFAAICSAFPYYYVYPLGHLK